MRESLKRKNKDCHPHRVETESVGLLNVSMPKVQGQMPERNAAVTSLHFLERIGIFPPLAVGYLGLLFFMIGDGVESGYLSPYLQHLQFSPGKVALIFTVYGITAAIAAWFSGALSDLIGPRKSMWIGLAIWVLFEILFLVFAIPARSYALILFFYGLRGFGYPLFAYSFLVWIAAATPARQLGTSVGWFWFAFTGGLPTLGSFFASLIIPLIGQYATFWSSLGLVIAGGLITLIGVREPTGNHPLVQGTENSLKVVLQSITIVKERPKVGLGGLVRAVNTASQFGFFVFMPTFFTRTVGFTLEQWLRLLSYIFLSNIIWNLLWGVIGDKFGWRRTVTYFGCIGCALTTLLMYYLPHSFAGNYPMSVLAGVLYGATLAGFVPLSALMPSLAPEAKGAAMSILNLGAGVSTWLGPAVVGIFMPFIGVVGVMWVFAILYLGVAFISMFLTLTPEMEAAAKQPDHGSFIARH